MGCTQFPELSRDLHSDADPSGQDRMDSSPSHGERERFFSYHRKVSVLLRAPETLAGKTCTKSPLCSLKQVPLQTSRPG